MIKTDVFYSRMAICQQCPNWKNVCMKGHGLSSPLGCPEKKFPGVEGAGYLEDRPVVAIEVVPAMPCCGGTPQTEVKELSYAEAVQHFVQDMKTWKDAGFPVLDDVAYLKRVATCRKCPGDFYKWFQCRACKCIIFSKAKLKTTVCPGGYWPPV